MQTTGNRLLSLIIVFFLGLTTYAQQIDSKSGIELINKKLSEKLADPYKRAYIYKDEPSAIKRSNPINMLFGGALYLYQNTLSKHISSGCLYKPSCSDFSKEAVRNYGIVKGFILSVDRLHRCDIFSATDLKKLSADPKTKKYPDPVSKYKRVMKQNDN